MNKGSDKMAVNIDEKILKKELLVEKIREQINNYKGKLAIQEKELSKLKDEKEFQELMKIKKALNNDDDVSKLLVAIQNKDVESIKSLFSEDAVTKEKVSKLDTFNQV